MVYQRKVKLALSRAEAEALQKALAEVKLSGTANRALKKLSEAVDRQAEAMTEKEASGTKGTFPARVNATSS